MRALRCISGRKRWPSQTIRGIDGLPSCHPPEGDGMPLQRDNFSEPTKRLLAQRGGSLLEPAMPHPDDRLEQHGRGRSVSAWLPISVPRRGVAPVMTLTMTLAQRSHADNGLMCQQCGKLIDPDTKYTVDMLHTWRRKSEEAVREIQTRKIVIPAVTSRTWTGTPSRSRSQWWTPPCRHASMPRRSPTSPNSRSSRPGPSMP